VKNKNLWKASRFFKTEKGKSKDTYNNQIILKAYVPIIKKYATGMLADIGCGDVPFYHFYNDQIQDNICVDWKNSSLNISFLDFDADLNKEINFLESNSFETVLCTDVLEHIHNPEVLFSEMTRILKKSGHLILTVPFLYWIHDNPHDYHRYTHFKLRDFCGKNKLEVVSLEAFGGLPEVIFDMVYKGYSFYNFPLRRMFLYSWKKLGFFLSRRPFVKRLSASSKQVFPMGYVLVAKKPAEHLV